LKDDFVKIESSENRKVVVPEKDHSIKDEPGLLTG